MNTTQIDAGEFRATQRRDWGTAAKGWHDWQELIIGGTLGVSERLVELARIKEGDRVLDVAAGSGEPAMTAARAVGPAGGIVATDIAPEMLAYGRRRAEAAGIDNIEFVESDASSLDFPPESFDAALSRWGIIFEPEAETAAARIRGFLKPGARMAISSWGPPDRAPMISMPMMTAMQRLGVAPPPPGTPGPLSRPTEEVLGGLLEGGGFADVATEEAEVTFEWESPEQYTTYVKEMSPRVGRLLANRPQEEQDALWAAVTDVVHGATDESGRVRLSNQALLAVGRARQAFGSG
jgi:ubiquinone/menaquinone biosynthesis C-methylase UbiE